VSTPGRGDAGFRRLVMAIINCVGTLPRRLIGRVDVVDGGFADTVRQID